MPERVRLSRAKGWKMPPNTVKVDRATSWGNPFVVGKHGTAAECVDLYRKLAAGFICLSTDNIQEQQNARANMITARTDLRGRNLACWCALDKPCHADVLLEIANGSAAHSNGQVQAARPQGASSMEPRVGQDGG